MQTIEEDIWSESLSVLFSRCYNVKCLLTCPAHAAEAKQSPLMITQPTNVPALTLPIELALATDLCPASQRYGICIFAKDYQAFFTKPDEKLTMTAKRTPPRT